MKKIYLLILLLSISAMASDTALRTGEFPQKEMKKQRFEMVKMMAKELNSKLPQTIDKYTVLASVKHKKSTLIYTFEINTGSKSDEAVKKEDRSRMKKAVTDGVCKSSKKLLAAGINTSYIYRSAKTKALLFQFDIEKKDCPIKID